jgi:hypothetical protein
MLDDIPVIIKENELIIKDADVKFDRLPEILKTAHDALRRRE